MTGKYDISSPFAKTPIKNGMMGYYVHRVIPATDEDQTATLAARYENAPDLLALDYFGDADWWWVIPQRNGLQDPIFDMKAGTKLIFPPKDIIRRL